MVIDPYTLGRRSRFTDARLRIRLESALERPFDPPPTRVRTGRTFAGTERDVDALEVVERVADEFPRRW